MAVTDALIRSLPQDDGENTADWNRWRGEITSDLRTMRGDMAEIKGDLKALTSSVGTRLGKVDTTVATEKVASALAVTHGIEETAASHWRTGILVAVAFSALSSTLGLGALILNLVR